MGWTLLKPSELPIKTIALNPLLFLSMVKRDREIYVTLR